MTTLIPQYDLKDGGSTPTGAINRPINKKLAESVSVLDFGADSTGVADSHDAFANAIATAQTVYVPKGTYNIGSPIVCTNPFKLVGDGVSSTVIQRNFSPTVDTNGIFTIQQGGTEICMRDMTLRSLTGQTGGCLVSIVPSVSGGMGLYNFSNIDFTTTGTSTHQYTLYFDGTAANTGAIGIRGLDMTGCSVFGGGVSTMLVKGVLKFSFVGGGIYTAGGAGTSNIVFTGTSTVPTQSFQFLPADCSCPISFDYATLGIFSCGIMGAITNTANSAYISGKGYSASVQNNWLYSNFLNTQTGLRMTGDIVISGGITNTNTSAPAGGTGINMYGGVTGNASGSVTNVGQVGVQNSTICPNTKTFTFTSQSGKLFTIATGGGSAALVFADYKSSTITLLSDPSSAFVAGAGPSAGFTNIYKSVNSHVISVTNNTGASVGYLMCAIGTYVSAVTDPA